jgi:predicted nucleic acid-binding protein
MSYLLDTCIISELRKQVPDNAIQWFADKNPESFYISVVTVGELLDGIERLTQSKKKKELEEWFFGDVLSRFEDRILPIDQNIAKTWGRMSANLRKQGITIGVQDLYIAATAQAHAFALLTTNTKHFKDVDIPLINPWMSSKSHH